MDAQFSTRPMQPQAGFAKVCITPPVGAPLAGYAARTEVSDGIYDELYVRAVALESSGQAAIVAAVEVLALSAEFTAGIRHRIAGRTGVPSSSIVIAATHTHSGPVTILTFFNPGETIDAAYACHLENAIVDACVDAWNARKPARIGTGAARLEGVAVNRRDPRGAPVDPAVGIVRIDDQQGQLCGVLFNYACHLTVLGPDNRKISGDLGAIAIAHIERELPGAFALFLNATEGNVSVGHSPSLSAVGAAPRRTREQACAFGAKLGGAVVDALARIATSPETPMTVETVRVNVPLRQRPTVEEALAEMERAAAASDDDVQARIGRLNATIQLNNARYIAAHGGTEEAELVAIGLGDCAIVTTPGEMFVETGLAVKQRAGAQVLIAGLANGYLSYVPTADAFERGGYEVIAARCAPGAAELIAGHMVDIIQRVLTSARAAS